MFLLYKGVVNLGDYFDLGKLFLGKFTWLLGPLRGPTTIGIANASLIRKAAVGKLKIETDMFIYVLEDHSDDIQYFLDIKTGKIVSLSGFNMGKEDELRERIEAKEGRFLSIEPIDSQESFEVMERFVAQLPEGNIKSELAHVLSHRKPFRSFKYTLVNYPEIRERWFLFHNQELKKMVQEWLEDNNIDAELLPLPEERR